MTWIFEIEGFKAAEIGHWLNSRVANTVDFIDIFYTSVYDLDDDLKEVYAWIIKSPLANI